MIYIEEQIAKKVVGKTSLLIKFDYNQEVVNQIKQMETPVYDAKTKSWEVPASCLSQLIDAVCIYDQISLKLLKSKPETKPIVYKLSKYKTQPFDYQIDGIQYGLNHDSWLLLDAPGLGKTLTLILLALELKKLGRVNHCLVVCGINTLKNNWVAEIHKHSDLTCRILGERINTKGRKVIGTVKERVEQLKHIIKEFFVITNIETLRSDDIVKELQHGKNSFEMCILDEAHVVKNPQSQQAKHLLKLNKFKYKIGATGTVLTNTPLDSYVPLKWIGETNATYTNYKYYYVRYGGPFGNEVVGYKNTQELKDQLASCSLRRTKDLLNLPPKTIIDEVLDMDDSQAQFYQNIKEGIVEQVDKTTISTSSVLGMITRLRQATVCPSILTTENIESAKINRACDLVEQIVSNDEKVVIFSTFKEPLNVLMEKLKDYNPLLCSGDVPDDKINANMNKFQTDPENKVMLCTSSKMGTGVTLTAASYSIFLDTPYTWAVYEQAQDRIHRIGSTKPVFIYELRCADTVDDRVYQIVRTKRSISSYIVDGTVDENTVEYLKAYIMELAETN